MAVTSILGVYGKTGSTRISGGFDCWANKLDARETENSRSVLNLTRNLPRASKNSRATAGLKCACDQYTKKCGRDALCRDRMLIPPNHYCLVAGSFILFCIAPGPEVSSSASASAW